MDKKLSDKLQDWRADRPDEWLMDEFIRDAEKLQSERDALAAHVDALENPTDDQLRYAAERVEASASVWEGFSLSDARCCYHAVVAKPFRSPQTSLIQHDTEVARKAFEFCLSKLAEDSGVTNYNPREDARTMSALYTPGGAS